MKKLIKQFEDIMIAITFAEAGEYEESNRLAKIDSSDQHDAAERMHEFSSGTLKKA